MIETLIIAAAFVVGAIIVLFGILIAAAFTFYLLAFMLYNWPITLGLLGLAMLLTGNIIGVVVVLLLFGFFAALGGGDSGDGPRRVLRE